MGTTKYTGSTPGGKLLAEAMDDLINVRDKIEYVQGLAVQVGNMTGSFSAASLESGSGIFEVDAGKGQEFFDKIGNIKSAMDTLWTAEGETILSLSQGG